MPDVQRILDANANRAREALRVMEDAARFLMEDAQLSETIKTLRHELAHALNNLSGIDLPLFRNTPGDVGISITTEAEYRRANHRDVVIAAGKRLSEALRSIEEFAKTLPEANQTPKIIEQLRYRGYDIEKQLQVALGADRQTQWQMCVLITEACGEPHDWRDVARQSIEGGADCLQLREKELDGGALLERAKWLVTLAKPLGVSVIINDRPDIAVMADADGVHLGQTDVPVEQARKIVGSQRLIGVSTSHLDQAKQAKRNGADYCGVGPMFETTTKQKPQLAGPAYLRQYLKWDGLPHLAIGGIHMENLPQLIDAGVRGIAVTSCVSRAQEPAQTVRSLMALLGQRGLDNG